MAYKIQFRLDEDILYFEIAGSICNHIDSITAYVRHRIAESRTQRMLVDLRKATGRPSPAKVFTHVLKYPPMRYLNCALIDQEHNRDFLLLYAKLMRHRGHRIQLFASIDEGTAWLLSGREYLVTTNQKSPSILRRLFQSILDACSVHPKARNDVHLRHQSGDSKCARIDRHNRPTTHPNDLRMRVSPRSDSLDAP